MSHLWLFVAFLVGYGATRVPHDGGTAQASRERYEKRAKVSMPPETSPDVTLRQAKAASTSGF